MHHINYTTRSRKYLERLPNWFCRTVFICVFVPLLYMTDFDVLPGALSVLATVALTTYVSLTVSLLICLFVSLFIAKTRFARKRFVAWLEKRSSSSERI